MNRQLVKKAVILGQLAQVFPIKNKVPITRVIPGQKFEPDLVARCGDACEPDGLRSGRAKDDDVKVFGKQR